MFRVRLPELERVVASGLAARGLDLVVGAGEVVGDQMIVTGTAPAGSTVTVKVHYVKKRFLDMSHDLTPQTVTTAADGTWTTAAFATKDALFGTPDSLDIQAELIDPATNEAISVEKIQVKGR